MIHAYNEYYLSQVQHKVASIFELAVYAEHLDIDQFARIFVDSPLCHHIEEANPIFVSGKSANELLGLVLKKEPLRVEMKSAASPEYWTGWVLS